MLGRKEQYAICGMYHIGQGFKGEDVSYPKQMFLGANEENRVYVYDEELTERSLIFDVKDDANNYIKAHNLNKETACTDGHFVLTITIW